MPKLERLEIVLTNAQPVYFPGQTVEGQLVVRLNAAMKMRGIRLKFRGRAHVEWEEGSGDSHRTFSSSEEYFDDSIIMFGCASNETNDTVVLPEGHHVFGFEYVLPMRLPSSFEGRFNCYVRYWIKGTIDKPWKLDPEVKMAFSVAGLLDLNHQVDAARAAQDQDSKTVCCWCCESPPITASFRIDRIGYVPGEAICLNAEVQNNCGREVWSTKVKMFMTVLYRTHAGRTHRNIKEIARLEHGSIPDGGNDIWSGERLIIPPIPPSGLLGCNIIDIDYKIEFKADVAETPFDLVIELGLIIGTIPLRAVVENRFDAFPEPVMSQPPPIGFSGPTDFRMPPPTYKDCVFGRVDITDKDDQKATGDMTFAPQYTYYDWMHH